MIARGRLAGEDLHARHPCARRLGAHRVVQRDGLEQVEKLPFVLVDALDVHVEQRVGIEAEAQALGDKPGEGDLVHAAHGGEPLAERRVVGERHERRELRRIVLDFWADRVDDELGESGIRLVEPAAEGDSVRFIDDAVGIDRIEVAEHRLPHEVGVQRRHAVDATGAQEREMAHSHAAAVVLLDHGDRRQERVVIVADVALRVEVQRVDEIDDLHVSRQQVLDQRHGPGLERFRQQRVVRVVEDGRRGVPGELPRHPVHVDQQAHQLGHGDGRVRVVQLDRHVVGKRNELAVLLLVPPEKILQRRRGEEELLAQPQLVARGGIVAGIEHARDRFEAHAVGERAHVVAAVEVVEAQRIGRARGPQSQRVDVPAVPTGDRRIEADRIDGLRRLPAVSGRAVLAFGALDGAAEADRVRDFGPLELPWIAGREPVLGQFELPAIPQRLPEDAVVVADAVAMRGNAERGHAFHEAGGEVDRGPRCPGPRPVRARAGDRDRLRGRAAPRVPSR